MQVKKVVWLSASAQEAEVELSDGTFTCIAFSCPCTVAVGDVLSQPLHVFAAKGIMLTHATQIGLWQSTEYGLGYKVVATLHDPAAHLITVGGLVLLIDEELPGGLCPGDLIEFECGRIDLW